MPGSLSAHRLFAPALLVAASCALSALAIVRDPLVGAESVPALVAAAASVERGFDGLSAMLQQPLHAQLIALLHALTGLPLLASAQLLETGLFALLALGFARLVTLLGAERRSFGWAALVVLLFPRLNEYRSQVLDETGFWALLMWAAVALARYRRASRWTDAFQFALCAALACWFRAEALVFALLLPLACLQRGEGPLPLAGVLRLYAALGTVALLPLLVLARLGGLDVLADHFFPLLTGLLPGIARGFLDAAARHGALVLGAPSAQLAPFSLAAGLLVVLALGLLRALGLVYAVVLGWAMFTRRATLPDNDTRALARALLACGLLVALALVCRQQAISARELMPLSLAVLIPASFAARELARSASNSRRPLAAAIGLVLLLALLLGDGLLRFGTRTSAMNESIAWMDANLPAGTRVFSNDLQLAWYSGGQVDWTAVGQGNATILARTAPLAEIDYWVLRVDAADPRLAEALAAYADLLEPVARFTDAGASRIVVLRRTLAPAESSSRDGS